MKRVSRLPFLALILILPVFLSGCSPLEMASQVLTVAQAILKGAENGVQAIRRVVEATPAPAQAPTPPATQKPRTDTPAPAPGLTRTNTEDEGPDNTPGSAGAPGGTPAQGASDLPAEPTPPTTTTTVPGTPGTENAQAASPKPVEVDPLQVREFQATIKTSLQRLDNRIAAIEALAAPGAVSAYSDFSVTLETLKKLRGKLAELQENPSAGGNLESLKAELETITKRYTIAMNSVQFIAEGVSVYTQKAKDALALVRDKNKWMMTLIPPVVFDMMAFMVPAGMSAADVTIPKVAPTPLAPPANTAPVAGQANSEAKEPEIRNPLPTKPDPKAAIKKELPKANPATPDPKAAIKKELPKTNPATPDEKAGSIKKEPAVAVNQASSQAAKKVVQLSSEAIRKTQDNFQEERRRLDRTYYGNRRYDQKLVKEMLALMDDTIGRLGTYAELAHRGLPTNYWSLVPSRRKQLADLEQRIMESKR